MTPFDMASRYLGVAEVPGVASSPLVLAMLKLDASWPESDDVPWCSAFVNWIAWNMGLSRSKSLSARSWLKVGIETNWPTVGWDIVVLKRGKEPQPDRTVLSAPGHVGFFAGFRRGERIVMVLGGNQNDAVSVKDFDASSVLAYRTLVAESR